MCDSVADLLHANDWAGLTVDFCRSDVAFLPTHLSEEDSLVSDDEDLLILLVNFEDLGVAAICVETDEFCCRFSAQVERADD